MHIYTYLYYTYAYVHIYSTHTYPYLHTHISTYMHKLDKYTSECMVHFNALMCIYTCACKETCACIETFVGDIHVCYARAYYNGMNTCLKFKRPALAHKYNGGLYKYVSNYGGESMQCICHLTICTNMRVFEAVHYYSAANFGP